MRLRSRDVLDVDGEHMAAAAGVRRAAAGGTARSHPPKEQNPGQRVARSQSKRGDALHQLYVAPTCGPVLGRHRQPAGSVVKIKVIGLPSVREQRHLITAIKCFANKQDRPTKLIVDEGGTGQPPHESAHLHLAQQQAAPQPAAAGLAPPPSSGQTANDSAHQRHAQQQAARQPGPAGFFPSHFSAEQPLGPDILGATLRNSWHCLRWRAIGCIGCGGFLRHPAFNPENSHHASQQAAPQPPPAGSAPPSPTGQPAKDQDNLNHAPQQSAPQPAPSGSAAPPLNIQAVIEDVDNIAKHTVTMTAHLTSSIEMETSTNGNSRPKQIVRNFLVLIYPKDLPKCWSQLVTDKMINGFRNCGIPISFLVGTVYEVQLYIHRNPLRQMSM